MNEVTIFIAPAAGRQPNPKCFLGYIPGGEAGGINYDDFADFGRLSLSPNPQCLPVLSCSTTTRKTGWLLPTRRELEIRAQMHQVVRHLEDHPLSGQEYERLIDLAASGPLVRKPLLDERLERLELIEEYETGSEQLAVECTALFFAGAYGQYVNSPYDGQLKLPYINIHGKLCHLSQITAKERVIQALQPDLFRAWLKALDPEFIVGHSAGFKDCPLANYILHKVGIEVEIGSELDVSTFYSFTYEGVMHKLPQWAQKYDEAVVHGAIEYHVAEHLSGVKEDEYDDLPDSVPVKAKNALSILEDYLKQSEPKAYSHELALVQDAREVAELYQ